MANYSPFVQFKDFIEYKIDKVYFNNFRGFEGNNEINFLAQPKTKNNNEIESVEWTKSKPKRYLKVISIYGKNASGKSTVLEVIKQIQSFLINTGISITGIGYNNNFTKFLNPSITYDINKPLTFGIDFSSKDINFTYKLSILFSNPKKIEDNNWLAWGEPKIQEIIILNSYKKMGKNLNKIIWNSNAFLSDVHLQDRIFFSQYRNRDLFTENIIKQKVFSEKQKEISFFSESFLDNFQKLSRADQYEISIERVLKTFVHSTLFIDGTTNDGKTNGQLIVNLSRNMEIFFGFTNEKISEILTAISTTVDKNIMGITYKSFVQRNGMKVDSNIEEKNQDNIHIELLVTLKKDNKKVPISYLSLGSQKFILQFLNIYFFTLTVPQSISKYIFIDELGSNWHDELSISLITLFKINLLKNSHLIFTSHNAKLADSLRSDAVNIINNEKTISTIMDKKFKKSLKFSNRYGQGWTDWFDSNPYDDDWDNLISLIEDEK